jgi:hypothetical protein
VKKCDSSNSSRFKSNTPLDLKYIDIYNFKSMTLKSTNILLLLPLF